jgi:hypothetical protein
MAEEWIYQCEAPCMHQEKQVWLDRGQQAHSPGREREQNLGRRAHLRNEARSQRRSFLAHADGAMQRLPTPHVDMEQLARLGLRRSSCSMQKGHESKSWPSRQLWTLVSGAPESESAVTTAGAAAAIGRGRGAHCRSIVRGSSFDGKPLNCIQLLDYASYCA